MMNVFEKIIERLEETKTKGYVTGITNNPYEFGACSALDRAVEIVNQVEKEHNNGWIPCSERLPEVNNFVLVESEHGIWIVRLIEYGNRKYFVDIYNDYSCPIDSVLAWQPLPQPYKERDTNGKN